MSALSDSAAVGWLGIKQSGVRSISKILILDFGSQVTQLIARRVRNEAIMVEKSTLRREQTTGCAELPADGQLRA